MANPRKTIYVVYIGCKTYVNYVWFHNGNDFITENYKTAEDELYRLKGNWKKIATLNICSPELDFIRANKVYVHNICIHISEITPNGESSTLKCEQIFPN